MSNNYGHSLSGENNRRKRKGKAPAEPVTLFRSPQRMYVPKLFGQPLSQVPTTTLFTGLHNLTPFHQDWNAHLAIHQILESSNEQLENALSGVLDKLVQERADEIIRQKDIEIEMKSHRIKLLKDALHGCEWPIVSLRNSATNWENSAKALQKKLKEVKSYGHSNIRSNEHEDAESSNHVDMWNQ